MNVCRKFAAGLSPSLIRSYATRYPRPKPGTSERPAYHPPDPLINNPNATVTPLKDEDLTFIHRPPPTAPSPFSLTTAPASPLLRPSTPIEGPLPPLVKRPRDKDVPRASDETIAEIRRLRISDPAKYTRGALAKKFGCTTDFIGMVAALKKPARKARLRAREEKHEESRQRWSERHSIVKAIKAKRREFW